MSTLRDKTRYHFDWLETISPFGLDDVRAGAAALEVRAAALLGAGGGLIGEGQLQTAMLAQLAAFAISPRQVFESSPDLVRLFELTSLGGIEPDMVRLPYPAFYLHLEGAGVELESRRTDERWPTTGLYVIERGGAWWITGVHHGGAGLPIAISWVWPHDDWARSGLGLREYVEANYETEGEHADWYVGALRLVVHLALYLSSRDPDVTEIEDAGRRRAERDVSRLKGRRSEAAREKLTRFSSARARRVGSSIEAAPGAGGPVRGHWVRGHWRRVWVGPKGGERKLEPRWIQPFVRGDLEAEGEARVYTIDEGGSDV